MQVNMAQKTSGIEDRRMKTSPFERGEDFISSDARYKKPGAGPGFCWSWAVNPRRREVSNDYWPSGSDTGSLP